YRVSFSYEQVMGPGSFGKPAVSGAWYKTLSTDLLDRRSVLGVRGDMAWIVGDAPVYERYYAGGFGSLRGFEYRGVSPRAGFQDNAIGGDFIVLSGAEYSFPVYGRSFRGVLFTDMGTVERSFEISSWRASVGFGLRVQLDFFGPVPLVFDFGFPIASDDDDEEQIFNFAFGASF
ncbi:MAG: BamA/TamA family outer membrane protein, partial [Planctomycetota bacterium]